ncbi:MAG: DUF2236 domain-containing protein [Cyclobacteriaceae bacterium]|nr:DUF2236 domain-containing protein [Cyclobacteriaceae bacterium HetDA_MAG_MS6]
MEKGGKLNQELDKGRNTGDTLADEAYKYILANPSIKKVIDGLGNNRQLQKMADENHPVGKLVSKLFDGPVPEFVNEGSQVFQRYTLQILGALGLCSLPYCYAGAQGAKVLIQSKYLTENPGKRLRETGQFVLDVCGPDSFLASGKAYTSILKVRLMHAAIRFHVRGVIVDEVPINQEDMAGTNISFSLITMRALRKLGVPVMSQEKETYVQLWSFISKLLGTSRKLLPANVKEAVFLEKKIRKRQFRRSEEGMALTSALVTFLQKQQIPIRPMRIKDLMIYLIGPEVSGYIGLEQHSLGVNFATESLAQAIVLRNWVSHYSSRNYAKALERIE